MKMGVSRLLHQHITTFYSSRSFGFARQSRLQLSSSSQAARTRKSEAVETYVRKYVETHQGNFPKLSHVQKEIGGSWYTLKELVQNAKEKIFGNSKVQSDSVNDVTSMSAADATASTNITTQDRGSEKSDQNEASDTLENAFCDKSNIPSNAAPCTSGEILSDKTCDTAMDAKRICTDLENTGPYNPRNIIQSSAKKNSEDNSVSQAISDVKPEQCSEFQLIATSPEGVCDSPYNRIPDAASDFDVDRVEVEGFLNNPNQQKKKSVQLKELHNAFDKPEKLSSLIYEATTLWQGKVEEEMASIACKNRVENKMFVGHSDKKIVDLPAPESENKHLELEKKPSTELFNSNAETTTATLQKVVPTVLVRNKLEQMLNQQKVSTVSAGKVSKESGIPASANGAQKFTRLSALFSKLDHQKTGQIVDKYTVLETNGHMENSDKNSSCNVSKPSDVNDLIDCIKEYPLGQQVTSGPGNVMSNKIDQNHHTNHVRVVSQVNMQKLDDEHKTSSSHIFDQKSEEPSVEAPMKITYKNGNADHQEKGNVKSVALNANIPLMRMGHLDNARDRTCKESLDQYKVIVKFLHKDVEEQDLLKVLERFDNNLKIKLSAAGKHFFKTATVYFKTWEGMQNALQATDLSLRNCTFTLEAASSLKSQSKYITIPSLIGDPDAPAALMKNPTRTVAIKELTHKISPGHIEKALGFRESNISGFFSGTSASVAYVEFETEDGKDRALAKQSIFLFGKRLFIYRVDTPRTTVVRIKTMLPCVIPKNIPVFKSLGNVKSYNQRSATILDVYYSITEWPNMLQIINKLNGMQVDGIKLTAEAAPIVPSDVLLQIHSQPEERKRLKSNMLRLLQKLEGNAVHQTKVTDIFSKFYGE